MNRSFKNIFPSLLLGINPYLHFLPFYIGNNQSIINPFVFLNVDNPNNIPLSMKQNENSNEMNQANSTIEDIGNDSTQSLEKAKEPKKEIFFTINYSPKDSLFTKSNNNCILQENDVNFLQKKRSTTRRPRKDNNDNIRIKIKRGFLNKALMKILNDKLRSIGSKQYFEKFPQSFIRDITIHRNKIIINMTLREIFEKE